MLQITRQDADKLRSHGLDEFIKVANRSHGSKAKSYYVIEHPRVVGVLNGEPVNKKRNQSRKKNYDKAGRSYE